ncbi:MAG: O-antigen ligase family protein [Desulfuromonadales bacterium]|nr:MAG: O-antigen ligase family protein [Desulfuromonadales bacterium]
MGRLSLFSLCLLMFILPIAHTATLRAVGVVGVLLVLLYRVCIRRNIRWTRTGFEYPFLAFCLAALVSVPFSSNIRESLGEIKGEVFLAMFLFYGAYLLLDREEDVLLLVKVLFAGSLVFSLYSFYDFYRHDGSFFVHTYRAGGLRDPGGGECAALYHCMVIPFLFWGIFYCRQRWQSVGLFVLFLINLVGLHMTFTRAAYLALGVQFIVATVMLLVNRRWVAGFLMLSFLVVGGVAYTQKQMFRELQTESMPSLEEYMYRTPVEIAGPNPSSMKIRFAMWKTAIDEIAKNPFRPHGFGRFLFGAQVRTLQNNHFIYDQTHNTFLGMWFELGLLGFLAFMWMIGSFLHACWRFWRASADSLAHWFAAGLMTMMAGYWVNNFFASFDADDAKILFMLLLGMGMALMRRIPVRKEAAEPSC